MSRDVRIGGYFGDIMETTYPVDIYGKYMALIPFPEGSVAAFGDTEEEAKEKVLSAVGEYKGKIQ
jgi:predicted RNase H-like HicB family nuclease